MEFICKTMPLSLPLICPKKGSIKLSLATETSPNTDLWVCTNKKDTQHLRHFHKEGQCLYYFRCVLLVVKLLRTNRKGPAQIAQMRNLSWAFTVSYLPFSHIEYQWTNINIQMNINHENIEKFDNYWLNLWMSGYSNKRRFPGTGRSAHAQAIRVND